MSNGTKAEGPLVTIISPAYNHANYVGDAIRSVIQQSYQNIEFIIINDGSPDNTAEKIEALIPECEERFTRVVFRDRANAGVVNTLNEGIALAKGKYVATMPSDDQYYPDAIATMCDFLEKNDEYVVAVGDNNLINDDGERCYWDQKRRNISDVNKARYKSFGEYLRSSRSELNFMGEDFGSYRSLLRGNYIPNGYLMRLSALKEIGGYNQESSIEDHNLMLQFAKLGKMKYFEEPLYIYRWHEANLIKTIGGLQEKGLKNLQLEKEYCERDHNLKQILARECDNLKPKKGLGKVIYKWKRSLLKRLGR